MTDHSRPFGFEFDGEYFDFTRENSAPISNATTVDASGDQTFNLGDTDFDVQSLNSGSISSAIFFNYDSTSLESTNTESKSCNDLGLSSPTEGDSTLWAVLWS